MTRAAAVLAMPRATVAAAGDDRVLDLPRPGPGRGSLDRLDQRPAQHPAALLGYAPADHPGVGFVVPRGQARPAGQLPRVAEPGDVPDLRADYRAQHRADARQLPDRGVSPVPGQ